MGLKRLVSQERFANASVGIAYISHRLWLAIRFPRTLHQLTRHEKRLADVLCAKCRATAS